MDWNATNCSNEYNYEYDCYFEERNASNTSKSWLEELTHANLKHSMTYTVVMALVYFVVFIVGTIGNIVVILVIGLRLEMRTVTNLFIFNLAVADLFVLLFCLPATLIAGVIKPWVLGSFMCWGVAYVQGVSVVASAYSLAAISVDRCKSILQHAMATGGFSPCRALTLILLIWMIAIVIPLPWAYVFELRISTSDGFAYCQENWESEELDILYFIFGNLLCCYIIPLCIMSSANAKIWLRVSHRRIPQGDSSSLLPASLGVQRIHRRSRRHVGKMLGIVTSTYLISWLPLYILATKMKIFGSMGATEESILTSIVPIAQWLAYWNSCVNPLFYAFFNQNFREMCKSLLPACIFDGICATCDRSRSRQTTLQIQEFVYNSRYEHGLLPAASISRKASSRRNTQFSMEQMKSLQNKQVGVDLLPDVSNEGGCNQLESSV